jgi:preprotein translocase subunit YajC
MINCSLSILCAQGEAGASSGGGMMGMMIPMLLIFGIFYFMMIRPQQRKEKERQRMISELRAGQRVMFGAGLIGKVVECRDDIFVITIANGVNIEVARGSVSRVLQDGESAKLDAQ